MENHSVQEDPIIEPERRTRRRLVQSTLFRCESREDEDRHNSAEEEDDDDEFGGTKVRAKKRQRKAQPKTPKKSPIKSKKAMESKNKSPPVSARSDFFLKVSERRLQQKKQGEQQETVDLMVESDKCCSLLESATSEKCFQPLKNGDVILVNGTPSKSRGRSNAKRSHSQRTMADCNSNCAKDLNTQFENMTQTVVDLRFEAKMAAKENARLSAGRQTHPFFSSWKAMKKIHDTIEIPEEETKWSSVLQGNGIFSCSPVHVFETLQDDLILLDWNDWTFYEGSLLDTSGFCGPEMMRVSVFEGSAKPLKVDGFVINASCRQNLNQQNDLYLGQQPDARKNACAMSKTAPSRFADGQEALERLLTYLEVMHQKKELSLFSGCTVSLDNIDDEALLRLRERMLSYHLRCCDQPNWSLWTNKYQPEGASEVCGNGKSVRSLSEWLQSWRERVPQTNKSSASSDKLNSQDGGSWCLDDSDIESMDEGATLKNVFLITGPVGSGKSAAIYACAKEQGFHVIEVSASDCRNGVLVKQKFGEAMESHGFNRWSTEEDVGLWQKPSVELSSIQPNSVDTQESDCEILEATSTTCKQEFRDVTVHSRNAIENKTTCSQGETKTLILFEDVDTIFAEDRGFIASLLQLAETAKRPMVLTSNSKDPLLPQHLNRLVTDFTLPSQEELLSEFYMVCVAEEAHISPQLVERFIRCCQGDIRKTIMLLQFWCQGKRGGEGRNIECTYSPLQFDLIAGHRLLPKLIPWEFPCQLSVYVEKEISKALVSMVKENTMYIEAVEERPDSGELDDTLDKHEIDAIKARKEAMLHRNCSSHDGTEFLVLFDDGVDHSNASGSPVKFARRNVRQKLSTVLSSDSEDDRCCTVNHPSLVGILSQDLNNQVLSDVSASPLHQITKTPGYVEQTAFQVSFENSETDSIPHIYDAYNLLDVSCVPESSYVPETEFNDGMEFLSRTVSCGRSDVALEDASTSGTKYPSSMEFNLLDTTAVGGNNNSENKLKYTCKIGSECGHGNEEVGDSPNEDAEAVTRGYLVMDECSRANFSAGFISLENPTRLHVSDSVKESVDGIGCRLVSNSVQDMWKRFRARREDLSSHLTSQQIDASEMVKLASRLTDLISETDVMLSCCQPLVNDALEPSMVPCVEPDYAHWYDEQLEMTSTFAEHGLCLYARKSASIGLNLGYENKVDLAQEMLACSTSSMAQGKLVTQEMRTQRPCNLDIESLDISVFVRREVKPKLFATVLSIVPSRSCLALKGAALHEYLSFLSQISRSEASKLQENNCHTKRRRRVRAARHYLSSSPFALSPEEVLLLAQHGCFKKTVSEFNYR